MSLPNRRDHAVGAVTGPLRNRIASVAVTSDIGRHALPSLQGRADGCGAFRRPGCADTARTLLSSSACCHRSMMNPTTAFRVRQTGTSERCSSLRFGHWRRSRRQRGNHRRRSQLERRCSAGGGRLAAYRADDRDGSTLAGVHCRSSAAMAWARWRDKDVVICVTRLALTDGRCISRDL